MNISQMNISRCFPASGGSGGDWEAVDVEQELDIPRKPEAAGLSGIGAR